VFSSKRASEASSTEDGSVADEPEGGEEHGEEDDAGQDAEAGQAVLPLVPLVAALVPAVAELPHRRR